MKNLAINNQKSSAKYWTDESGLNIPVSRLTKTERMKESRSAALVRKALKMHDHLSAFKAEIEADCKEIKEEFMKTLKVKTKEKAALTWYNFDGSIKVQMTINQTIGFDDLGIQACKAKLDEFLEHNLESKDAFIKQMVMDAFGTRRGQLDAKKVLALLKYKSKIKSPKFQEAMKHMEDSIENRGSKTYYRLWAKDEAGEYQNIDLNFSSVK